MKSTIGWIVAFLLGAVLLLVIPVLWMMGRVWTGGYGGMMGSYGYMHPFGWGWMMVGWLIPVVVIVLLVIGVVALLKALNRPENTARSPVAPSPTCPNCGRSVQADWSICPYCGQNLTD